MLRVLVQEVPATIELVAVQLYDELDVSYGADPGSPDGCHVIALGLVQRHPRAEGYA